MKTYHAFLAGVAVCALLSGCGPKHSGSGGATPALNLPTVPVRVQAVESRKEALTEEVVGTVRAKRRATLEANVSGRIEKLPLVLGQKVKAADLAARLDAPEIQARLEQAQANLEQAERDWKRNSALLQQQAATRAEYDVAEAHYQSAKAAVAEARAMVGYVEVQVPFDGVVTRKWAEVGDLAAPGKPLVEIEDLSTLQVEADVPETIASKAVPDARLGIRVDSLTNDLLGVVAEIAPSADPLSRTFRVKLDLAPGHEVMPGQFARVLLPVGESNALRVPASAAIQRGQLDIVFVAVNQHAQLRLVKTGRRFGPEVEILAGLEAGESVVVEGAAQLADGQPVQVK